MSLERDFFIIFIVECSRGNIDYCIVETVGRRLFFFFTMFAWAAGRLKVNPMKQLIPN